MNSRKTKLATLVAVLTVAFIASATPASAQLIQLAARKNKVINGIEAELRGDYRENNGIPRRLDADLENINIPLGTPIAFCLQDSVTLVKTKIGVGKVALVGGIRMASVDLNVNDGEFVPKVTLGDKLQARQSAVPPFKTSPGCGAPLLVAAPFK